MKSLLLLTLLASGALSTFGQTPATSATNAASKPFGVRPSPRDPVPGLIARAYLDGSPDAKKFPTHVIAVIQNGDEFINQMKPLVKDELRGKSKSTDVFYVAAGWLNLEKDGEVRFEIGEGRCFINGKDFGGETYSKPMKKGRYPIEITRRWGKGQQGFAITGPDGAGALFHSGEMLNRELSKSIKLEGRTYKTVQVGASGSPKP